MKFLILCFNSDIPLYGNCIIIIKLIWQVTYNMHVMMCRERDILLVYISMLNDKQCCNGNLFHCTLP